MILTVRTWQLERRDYAEFARVSEDEYWPLFEKHGGRALDIWIVRYIEFYNSRRPHRAHRGRTPDAAYFGNQDVKAAA